ncbi:hypothetical protein [Actinophytocola sp.]|uniref:hypothetical protein n=1 Tax=Actinophytocola sp. TaxID=1872138 RepID=UPI002ED3331B
MYIGVGSVQVTATISIHGDTAMTCVVGEHGDVELRIGSDSDASLFLTERGATKLMRTLTDAGLSTRAPS